MSIPDLKVEVAFDSTFSTAEGARTWTDVTAYVNAAVGVDISYGRADELSVADPNTLALTFKNDDGRFTPGKSTSPYYPNVKKGKPVRVQVRYNAVWYVRYVGYINEWPVAWPTGGQESCDVSITASSRRARMGQTAPLTSAIRAAYMASEPNAYWPMDEDVETIDRNGLQAFRDITNTYTPGFRETQFLAAIVHQPLAGTPVVHDGTQGPTDEQSLVRIPAYTDVAMLFNFAHFVGAGNAISVNSAGEFTVECVARIEPTSRSTDSINSVIWVGTSDQSQALRLLVNGGAGPVGYFGQSLEYTSTTGVVAGSSLPSIENLAAQTIATDGEIHHIAMTLTAGNTVVSYLDGVAIFSALLDAPWTYDRRFTQIAFGSDTYNSDLWVGHGAVYDRALTAAEILVHANAATAVSETVAERVVRVAGRVGVPAAEVDVEATIAADLGPQAEATRSASEVIDEVATSTGGVVYDTRVGHLAMQARNHRYNQTSAFTLSTAGQEIEVDFSAVLDDRYLVNTVEFTRVGVEVLPATVTDDASIDDYGVYSKSLSIVSSSDAEVQAAAADQILRYAQPVVRITQVSVDVVDLSTAQRALVLAADIGTLFTISGLPTQAPASSMPLYLEGYSETISAAGHSLTINTTPGDLYTNVAVLDDPAHDLLDSGITLAY